MAKKNFTFDAIDKIISEPVQDNVEDISPKKAKKKDMVVSFRMNEETVKKLKGYAFYEKITIKEALEKIINGYLSDKNIAKQKGD